MAVLKNNVREKTAFLTVPDNFWVTFGIYICNHISDVSDLSLIHISDVSDDAKYDVIYCLFSAKIDDTEYNYAAS